MPGTEWLQGVQQPMKRSWRMIVKDAHYPFVWVERIIGISWLGAG
jgi:hypothetical protein